MAATLLTPTAHYLGAVDDLARLTHRLGRGHPRKPELVVAIETLPRAHLRDLCSEPALFDAQLVRLLGLTQVYLAGLVERMAETTKALGTPDPNRVIDAHGPEIAAPC